jgi:hypothetical protein
VLRLFKWLQSLKIAILWGDALVLYPISQSQVSKLKKIPQADIVWEAIKVPAHKVIKSPPEELVEAEVVIWGDLTGECIRSMQFIRTDDQQALIQSLSLAIMGGHNTQPAARPRRILIRDRRLMLVCQALLRDIDVNFEFVDGHSIFDDVVRDLGEELAGFKPPKAEELLPIEHQSRRLWELAPWTYIKEVEVLRIHFPHVPDLTLFAVTVGGGIGLHLGVLFFRDRSKIVNLFQRQEGLTIEQQAANFENCYSVTFDVEALEDKKAQIEKNKKQQRKGASAEVPPLSIAVVDSDVDLRPLHDQFEIAVVQAALTGYVKYVEKFQSAMSKGKHLGECEVIELGDDDKLRELNLHCVEVRMETVDQAYIERSRLSLTQGPNKLIDLFGNSAQINPETAYSEENHGPLSDTEMLKVEDEDYLEHDNVFALTEASDDEFVVTDLRAGRYSLTVESLSKSLIQEIPIKQAYFAAPLLAEIPRHMKVFRFHLPKRRAKHVVDVLSQMDLNDFLSLYLDESEQVASIMITDQLDRAILGDLKDCINLDKETLNEILRAKDEEMIAAIAVTSGALRPGAHAITGDNLVGMFLSTVDESGMSPV